jgi:Cft2 family RNA processing exonuclease
MSFLTHSHLDHIGSLPLLIDSVSDLRTEPVTVHATAATLDIIGQAHLQLVHLAGFQRHPEP